MTGNRCGHDRLNPRTRLARPERSNLPRIIVEAMKRAEGIVSARGQFPEFSGQQLRLLGSRKRRSERLEAIALVTKALLCQMDILSQRVGRIAPLDRCHGVTMVTLAKWTELRDRRIDRAIYDLHNAGYMRSVQPVVEYKADIGLGYIGLPAVRTFTQKFFRRCGLHLSLKIEQRKAYTRRRRATITDPKTVAAIRRAARPQRQAERAELRVISNEERARRYTQLALDLRTRHPEWTAERVRAEARRMLE